MIKEAKHIFKSIKLLVSSYPLYLLLFFISLVAILFYTFTPIYIVDKIVSNFNSSNSLSSSVNVIIIGFILVFNIYMLDFYCKIINERIKRLFISKQSIVFYQHLCSIDYEYHENPNFLNDYTRVLEESVDHIYKTANSSFKVIQYVITSISLFVSIISLNILVVLCELLLGVLYGILRIISSKLQFKASTLIRPNRRITYYHNRMFTTKDAINEIKTTNIDDILIDNNNKAYDNINKVYTKLLFPKTIIMFFGNLLLELLYPIVIILLVYLNRESLTINSIAVLSVSATTLSSLISQLSRYLGEVQSSAVECRVPFDLLKKKGVIESKSGKSLDTSFNQLHIDSISFKYEGNNSYALKDVSLTINKGDKIAIVGRNGSGKTTLVKLLLRLYDPECGALYINNNEYKELNVNSIRDKIGAVFQNIEVYAISIAENILLRNIKSDDDIELVNKSLKFSGLYDYVYNLKDNIYTVVTKEFDKNGVNFSVGLMQKLAIARGYAQNYDLFILDEPSSALDAFAETELYNNLINIGIDKTIIFISHRLTSTVNASYIYLLDKGSILEQGTHKELIDKNGVYAYMFDAQAHKYLEDSLDTGDNYE